jgi:hypothetical protein
MDPEAFITLGIAVALAAVHLVAAKLRFLKGTPRSIWLSGAGGVSVAYVFVHVLPELASAQEHFEHAGGEWLTSIELHSWLLALSGLTIFYGLERHVKSHRRGIRGGRSGSSLPAGVFWIHTGSFALYNVLFGYLLLHREDSGRASLFTFAIAIGLHFVVNDYGLREDHRADYDRVVRWVLVLSVLSGWALGMLIPVHRIAISAMFALLAGGIVLNVIKEELPEDRESRFWAFATGAALYSALLLAI